MKNGIKIDGKNVDYQTRRDFLQSSAFAGAAFVFAPMISTGHESTEKSDEINVALIGAGAQGQFLIDACRNIPGVRFKAVCDIWAEYNLKRVTRILQAYYKDINEYEDYKQMLETEKNLDAVIIATPDFCHAEQTVACLKAGLHVYCESEMSNTIEGAKKMVQAARQIGKLLQIGRQRRSNPRYLHCFEKLIKKYELFGQIIAVNGQWNRPVYEPLGWPEGTLLSDETLKKYGYKSMAQFRNWRWYKGLGNGPVVDLGSQQIDIYNWFLEAAPNAISASGRINFAQKNGYEWYDTVMVLCEYETSHGRISAFYQTIPSHINERSFEKFVGKQGTLIMAEYNSRDSIYPETRGIDTQNWLECIKNGNLTASKEILDRIFTMQDEFPNIFWVDETPDPIILKDNRPETEPFFRERPALHLPIIINKPYCQPHLENFFDAIRGKAKLNCSAETGYKTALSVLKINEAIESGEKIRFKPEDFAV